MDASEYRSCREELGLSQTALALKLGVSRETVSNRERDTGRSRINEEAALAIKALVSLSNIEVSHEVRHEPN